MCEPVHLSLVTGLENAVSSWMRFSLHNPRKAGGVPLVTPCLQVHDTAVMGITGPVYRASGLKA